MKLSDGEKLILVMLSEIHANLKIRNGIDPKLVLSAIDGGYHWGLKWAYPGIFHGAGENEPAVTETCDVLDMWYLLEASYEKLSPAEKERVVTEGELSRKELKFDGFDANNEEHYGIARFLIHDLGRFSTFGERDINSHFPSIEMYRRMLAVFKPLRQGLGRELLTAAQLIDVLNARVHPDYRPAK
jgi:uncharacterized protein YfbU (UPF0304 family)